MAETSGINGERTLNRGWSGGCKSLRSSRHENQHGRFRVNAKLGGGTIASACLFEDQRVVLCRMELPMRAQLRSGAVLIAGVYHPGVPTMFLSQKGDAYVG